LLKELALQRSQLDSLNANRKRSKANGHSNAEENAASNEGNGEEVKLAGQTGELAVEEETSAAFKVGNQALEYNRTLSFS
jgi:hypothetical protein